ncbi:class I SAM-dependent methyltransferase [Halalkalicoccus ordinarius]|uniref:class I SAM-dependent methyltransferase n=1 Tax=Halalkalicoccus ordinarius TaxID=3116651 RepID=UPI00300F5B61
MNSDEVLEGWAERSGEYSPEYYAYYGPDETSDLIRDRIDAVVGPDAAVLELGCSSGRHLAHLHDGGYEDLHGIEINGDAFDVMADSYPDLAAAGTFHHGAIEDVVREFGDDAFDAVYSVETLQHVHPDNEWVFEELARITADLLVTVENEGGDDEEVDVNYVNDDFPLFYRDWRRVFTALGLDEIDAVPLERDTFRAFRATER